MSKITSASVLNAYHTTDQNGKTFAFITDFKFILLTLLGI